jgi:proteic killer suppression protein
MIKRIKHKALRRFYDADDERGLRPDWIEPIREILSLLDQAARPSDMNIPGFDLHPLKGNLKSFWSVRVNRNWRVVFRFEDQEPTDVDLTDYH